MLEQEKQPQMHPIMFRKKYQFLLIKMKKIDPYKYILQEAVLSGASDEEIALYMLVLHTHSIVLSPQVIIDDIEDDDTQNIILPSLTRYHLSELMASIAQAENQHKDVSFWHYLYCSLVPYEVFEDVPISLVENAVEVKRKIEKNPLIRQLIEE